MIRVANFQVHIVTEGPLLGVVKHFYEIRNSGGYQINLWPEPTPEMCWNLADAISGGNQKSHYAFDQACITGQRTLPKKSLLGEQVHLFGVQFHANGLYKLFQNPQSEVVDQIFDTSHLLRGNLSLNEELYEKDDFYERINRVSSILIASIDSGAERHPVDRALHVLERFGYTAFTKELSREVGVSYPHLIRQFKEQVGMSIKHYSTLRRFRKVLELLKDDANSLTKIAHTLSFFDQSHFVKTCRQITGLSPKELRKVLQQEEVQAYKSCYWAEE